MKNLDDLDKMAAAQSDFERNFGISDSTDSWIGELGGEQVIVVENGEKQAVYSMNIELLKINDLMGDK